MERHLIKHNVSIVGALEAINRLSGDTMVLFVIDDSGWLIGSLTDGDVRRALLSGHRLSDAVADVCKRDCLYLETGGKPASHDSQAIIKLAREKGISLLPILKEGVVVSLLDLNKQRGMVPVVAVLMAGGFGERLRPLTVAVPKPLLPVGGKPIIDHNVELLQSFGIESIYVAVNYLKNQIIDHFSETPGITVVEEPQKMGTIGALSLIPELNSCTGSKARDIAPNVLVMNADLLTDVDIEAMYARHVETAAAMTMAVVPYPVSVPFAIVEHDGDRITGLAEKPTYNYYANAGIYLLRSDAVAEIPCGKYFDATDLAERLLAKDLRVTLFPIEGRWLDIGTPDDYRHACEII